jgi:hypothetical protein
MDDWEALQYFCVLDKHKRQGGLYGEYSRVEQATLLGDGHPGRPVKLLRLN